MIMRSTNNSILIKHAYYKRRARAIIANVSLIAIVLCICIMMLLYGNTNYSLDVVIRVLRGENIQGANFAIATLRLPRMLSGLLVGIAFGIAGNTFQTMLRNPLASPDIIGVTSGSSVAAVFCILVLGLSGPAVSIISVISGLLVSMLIYLLSKDISFSGSRLILIGIGIQAMLQAAISFLLKTLSDCVASTKLIPYLRDSVSNSNSAEFFFSAKLCISSMQTTSTSENWRHRS